MGRSLDYGFKQSPKTHQRRNTVSNAIKRNNRKCDQWPNHIKTAFPYLKRQQSNKSWFSDVIAHKNQMQQTKSQICISFCLFLTHWSTFELSYGLNRNKATTKQKSVLVCFTTRLSFMLATLNCPFNHLFCDRFESWRLMRDINETTNLFLCVPIPSFKTFLRHLCHLRH